MQFRHKTKSSVGNVRRHGHFVSEELDPDGLAVDAIAYRRKGNKSISAVRQQRDYVAKAQLHMQRVMIEVLQETASCRDGCGSHLITPLGLPQSN